MQEEGKRYRVYENVGLPPPPNTGPSTKWGDLPLDTIQVGDQIEIPLTKDDVDGLIRSVQGYVYRLSRKTGKRYSVRKTEYGIGIWRVEDNDETNI